MSAFISNNATEVDPKEREASLREKVPELLAADEHVILAFKARGGKGRDSSCMTNLRIILKDKQGMSGKKTEYKSIPYKAIRGYAVETAGSLDGDVELKLYCAGVGKLKYDFMKKEVDIFKIKRFLNQMVLVGKGTGLGAGATAITTDPSAVGSGKTSIFDLVGDNASQIDAKAVESALRTNPRILVDDESVELAFKCGRDSFLLTDKRILQIDVQGASGKRIEYFTILWPTVKAFSIESAGNVLDRDAELRIFTNLPDTPRDSPGAGAPRRARTRINIDFRKGRADIYAIQRFFADKVLGTDTVDPSASAVSMAGQVDSGSGNPFSWMGDDSRMVDAEAMDRQYKVNPPILQHCEKVEMAFKGRRDLVLMTSKRLLFVDIKGAFGLGKKVEFTSLPWTTVTAFGVKSAGSFMDKDSECLIWTDFDDIWYPPTEGEDSPPPPPIPRRSFIELDFQKDKVDLMAVHRYLSERCLRVEGGHKDADGYYTPNLRPYDMPVSPDIMAPTKPGALDAVLGWLGNDAHALNPAELNAQLHGDTKMLQDDERAVLAYKAGRDTLVFTNKRIFIIDVQGMSGKRIAYKSVPYSSVRSFAVESAGSWDTDSEVKIWGKFYWMDGPGNKIKQDLRKGKADIIAIQAYLAEQTIGSQDGKAALPAGATAAEAGKVSNLLSFLGDNAVSTNPSEIEKQFKTSPRILQSDEKVEQAYKCGRDLCVFTSKRIVLVDRQGMSGKRIEYRTVPLRYCHAFKFNTAGSLMSEPKCKIYVSGAADVQQDLSKSSSDVWSVQKILAEKILKK